MTSTVLDRPFVPTEDNAVRPVRALVVDDVTSLAELVAMTLQIEGWHVRVAETGTEALAALADFQPDLVVLDRMLPDLTGLEVLLELHRRRPDLPVVLLTALDSAEARLQGMQAGAADYVVKPFSLADLVSRLRRVVVLHKHWPRD